MCGDMCGDIVASFVPERTLSAFPLNSGGRWFAAHTPRHKSNRIQKKDHHCWQTSIEPAAAQHKVGGPWARPRRSVTLPAFPRFVRTHARDLRLSTTVHNSPQRNTLQLICVEHHAGTARWYLGWSQAAAAPSPASERGSMVCLPTHAVPDSGLPALLWRRLHII